MSLGLVAPSLPAGGTRALGRAAVQPGTGLVMGMEWGLSPALQHYLCMLPGLQVGIS